MKRLDANEAVPIVDRMLANLVAAVPPAGRIGSQARAAIGDVRANSIKLLMEDAIGPPLDNCFDLTVQSGATLQQLEWVRQQLDLEAPTTLGATLIKTVGIRFCLAFETFIISNMTFVSRQDVDALKHTIQTPFQEAEEIAADSMDQMTFQALISMHGALVNHLVQTARPLPQMLQFEFAQPMPSLVLAYRLYGDASRADELREENKVVHPAFCPPTGQALSA